MFTSRNASVSQVCRFYAGLYRSFIRQRLRRKLLCLALMLSLLAFPGTDLVFRHLSAHAFSALSLPGSPVIPVLSLFARLFAQAPTTPLPETLAARRAYVSHIHITPARFVGYVDDQFSFSALPTDSLNRTIQGVRFTWESSDPNKLTIDDSGHATFSQPGMVTITCRAGSAVATAPVLIRPGRRPVQSDAEWRTDQSSMTASAGSTDESGDAAGLLAAIVDKLSPTVHAQSGSAYIGNDFPYDELYNEPRNLIGSPHNRAAESTRLGQVMPDGSNFKLTIPIISLGGRGPGASLTLHYNSRVWGRHASAVTFDPVASWPSPGFSLGFGRIVTYGPTNALKYLLIDPDGTRHYLGQGGDASQNVTLQTNDGTHITYVGNASYGGTLYFNDGTQVGILKTNNRLLPWRILDTNGNHITIAYKVTDPPVISPLAIDFVTDTLGRVIQFEYDTDGHLTSIFAPAFGGTSQNPLKRTLIQFNYETRSFGSGLWSGLTGENYPTQGFDVVRRIRFDATSTGYLFTYSAYSMIYNYSLRRDMSYNSSTGVIGDGTERALFSLNYPTSASSFTDAPAFNQRTETATSSPSATYSYSTSDDAVAQTKTFTITQPDSSQLLLTRSTNPVSKGYGRLVQNEIKKDGASFAKTILIYENDLGGSPQLAEVTSYNDAGVPIKVSYNHDLYGNVTDKLEYGFQIGGQWAVRRRTHYRYLTGSAYINNYMRSLNDLVEVFDAQEDLIGSNDVLISKSRNIYDDYEATGGMENYGGTAAPPGHLTSYGTGVTVRGNVTGVTSWIDLATNNSITKLKKYDIFGNMVKEEVSCCNEMMFTRTEANCWSQPEQVTKGDPSGIHLTTSAVYDFNTSAIKSQSDPNGNTKTQTYDAAMRPATTTFPTGASRNTSFNDALLTSSKSASYDDDGVSRSISASAKYDGWGQEIETVSAQGGQINTSYDAMGRVASRTNPFTAGGTPGPSTSFQYDALGRQMLVTQPDGNTIQITYSGNTVTTTNQVNRKSKQETDGLGRLVKVIEQNASGTLSQHTNYTYDLLDRLILVDQGGQTRAYKHDGLGRLLFERIPEQTATINDGTGTLWTTKYTHTTFDAISTRQDARGVVTNYGYDTLNRLTSISYNTSGAPGVASTGNVTYTYDTNQASPTNGLLLSISIGGSWSYQESYGYDSFERLSSITRTVNSQSYTTSYLQNAAGQRKRLTYPSTRIIKLNYDNKGRPLEVTNGENLPYLYNIGYNAAGQITGLNLGNGGMGVTESYGYDTQRGQMTSQTATKSGANLLNLTYSYQAAAGQNGATSTAGNSGRLMSISGTINSTTESAAFTYDLLGRLVTSNQTTNSATAQRRFEYDRWGNRTAVYNQTTGGSLIQSVAIELVGPPPAIPTNHIASVGDGKGSVNYTYDAAGNVTTDGAHSYTYDAENRLVSVDAGATATYNYDHQNQRVKKAISGATVHYVLEGGQVIAEHNASTGAVLVEYIYSGSRMIAKVEGTVTRYFISDRLSVRLMLDSSGNVVGRQGHLPFGEELGSSGTTDKHKFTGYERDGESDTDYAVNRQYANGVGRFMQVDPLASSAKQEDPQTLNRYAYATNDAINKIDPKGLEQFGCYGCGPLDPWALDEEFCRSFGARYLLDGFDMFARFFCGGEIAAPFDPFDLLGALFPGKLTVDGACQNAIYIPEGVKAKVASDWKSAVGVNNVDCDVVGTPRGIVKIPDGCSCAVSCSGDEKYVIRCTCVITRFFGGAPRVPGRKEFPDPMPLYPWVGKTEPLYTIPESIEPPSLPLPIDVQFPWLLERYIFR